ncbi:MAG: NADH-quinone oxidoreductase subunit J [Planctomycetes bacterium]|nr:NADH-quinone oxidoreductase subunit J [Planctomycetota bacterium]
MANLLFYLVSLGAVVGALGVVAARNPVVSVLSLLGTFFCLATIYLLAGFEFLAAAQILVYAGAIMVLFLFVIMLLNLGGQERPLMDHTLAMSRRLPLVVLVGVALAAVSFFAVARSGEAQAAAEAAPLQVDTLGGLAQMVFGTYLLPFELSSVLLLAAAIAVLVLAKRERGEAGR